MLQGPLAFLQELDPGQAWRLTMQRDVHRRRVWRLYLADERSPRLTLREP